ncbi:uncharacterized protein ARMOST_17967 [Armillaria ostoyae]|uniref:Uncharacterized protein n=1 Tax=Armillaria ostoyae TaxID=47428 RepID=A0A284S0P0_ARMOS|nr:uncharacterized protein ARMOST_17967 [Armillaria ostoyae]
MDYRTGGTAHQHFALGAARACFGKAERSTAGFIAFGYQGKGYQTCCKVVSKLDSRQSRAVLAKIPVSSIVTPILSNDDLPSPSSVINFSVPVIFYGNSRSTHLRSELRAIDLFIDELFNFLEHFHIHDRFDLFGHSWDSLSGARGAKAAGGIAPLHVAQLLVGYGDAEHVN